MEAPIKRPQHDWDKFFFTLALQAAGMSKDPNRQVGAVLVSGDRRQISFGFNGFPPEIPDLPELLADRDFRLANMRHAEDNCFRQAPFNPAGCTLYVTRFPCFPCATLVADNNLARVVAPEPDLGHARWGQSWQDAIDLFHQRHIHLTYFVGDSTCDCC